MGDDKRERPCLTKSNCVSVYSEKEKQNRSEYGKHFVEELSLRNVALDEDVGDSSIDGHVCVDKIVTSTNVVNNSNDDLIILHWDWSYFRRPQGLLRVSLLACCIISMACIVTAGTSNRDVLHLPLVERIRFHIFTCAFAFLLSGSFLFLDFSSVILALPLNWNIIDGLSSCVLGIMYTASSSLLLHTEHIYQRYYPLVADWSRLQVALSAVFGFMCTLVCMFLSVLRCCGQADNKVLCGDNKPPENIMMSTVESRT